MTNQLTEYTEIHNFGEQLATILARKNISWRTVANDLNIGINQLYYWRRSGAAPKYKTMKKIADYLCMSVDDLINNDKIMAQIETILNEDEPTVEELDQRESTPDTRMYRRAKLEDILKNDATIYSSEASFGTNSGKGRQVVNGSNNLTTTELMLIGKYRKAPQAVKTTILDLLLGVE